MKTLVKKIVEPSNRYRVEPLQRGNRSMIQHCLASLLLCAWALKLNAQIVTLDGVALHTNIAVTTGAQLTVLGWFTNDTYTASNHDYVTQGDAWQPTGISKINSNFAYCTNQFVLLTGLPNQINTNMAANIAVISNEWLTAFAWVNANSNRLTTISNMMGSITNEFATNPVGGKMNFDNVSITSDGGGNISATSVKAELFDSANSSGSSAEVATANGDGTWSWAAASGGAAMNFDGGLITSDGSSGIITVHHTGSFGDPTGGAEIQTDNSPVNSSDPNNINFLGPNQDGGGSGGYDILETADRMIDFHANGYTSDNTSIHFSSSGRCKFDTGDFALGGNTSIVADAPGVFGGHFLMDQSSGFVGINNPSPAYYLDVAGTMGDSVDGGWNIDSSGNITCLSLTQTSDQNAKTNFTPVNTANVLASLQSLTVSNWNFKGRLVVVTNIQIAYASNAVVTLRTNARGAVLSRTNWMKMAIATNAVAKTRTIAASGQHIGPMAQEWHNQFGGSTNGINVTDAIGVLIAGEQELARGAARSTTNGSALPLKSPNGTVWYVKVSDAGALTASRTP